METESSDVDQEWKGLSTENYGVRFTLKEKKRDYLSRVWNEWRGLSVVWDVFLEMDKDVERETFLHLNHFWLKIQKIDT